VDNKAPTSGEIVIMAAGALMLIASFFDFIGKRNAWGSGEFPIVTLIVIYGVVVAGQIALTKYATVSIPDRIAGMTWAQIDLALSVFALLMTLGWLLSGIPEKGIGLWLILLGSIALVVGSIMVQRERHTGIYG
jgi:hypothetical protein